MGDVKYPKGVGVHSRPHLTQVIIEGKTLNKICKLRTKYPLIKPCFDYIYAYWVPKVDMSFTCERNIWYANQNTNVSIEAYHGNLKVQV